VSRTRGAMKRILVIVDRLEDYQLPLIEGVESATRERSVGLVILVCHPLDPDGDVIAEAVVAACDFSGVVLTGMTNPHTLTNRTTDMLSRVQGLAKVTLGVGSPGVSSVFPDNAGGVRAAVSHLVSEGCSRPLFLAGVADNQDSNEREAAFLQAAREHGLRLPSRPVLHAGFQREPAYRLIDSLLVAGRDFDAIVAANDVMAFGAYDALREHGVRIPADVSVVGFDNTTGARHTNPPLTSVDAQLVQQGRNAALLLLDNAEERGATPREVRVATSLVVRESSSRADRVRPEGELDGTGNNLSTADISDLLLGPPSSSAGNDELDTRRKLRAFLSAWLSAMQVSGHHSDSTSAAELTTLIVSYSEPYWWRSMFRTILHQTEVMVGKGTLPAAVQAKLALLALHGENTLSVAREQRDYEQLTRFQHLLELDRAFSWCHTAAELLRAVGNYLPRLGIRRCFVTLLERTGGPSSAAAQARLVLSYRDGMRLADLSHGPYPATQLLPTALMKELDHDALAVQQLFVGSRHFGMLMHQQESFDIRSGEALRERLSNSLDAISRTAKFQSLVVERTAQLEQARQDLETANADLRRAILVDGLTGLQNRPSFDDHLRQAWEQHSRNGTPLSLLMIDVDHFKLYNDTCGHLEGDRCLRLIATCLRTAITRKQDIVARFGGEEFVVILPLTGRSGARRAAQRLLETVRDAAVPHPGLEPGSNVSVTIGICSDSDRIDSPETMIRLADEALYRGKHNGRNRAIEADTTRSIPTPSRSCD
jgi:diguanylate cyclase (GGDEF)-like protein